MLPDRPLKPARTKARRPRPVTKGADPYRRISLPRNPFLAALLAWYLDVEAGVHRLLDRASLRTPAPVLRLELIRILAPLATLGFMSSRLAHADEWLTNVGFQVPPMDLPDWRQPFYLSPLSTTSAWTLAAVMVLSGLAVTVGFRARAAALVFAATLAYVALADRLAAFTVSKLSPAVMLALAASPCGVRFGVDAWMKHRREPDAELPTEVSAGGPRFFQILLPVFYVSSAVAKGYGDWLKNPLVLFTHMHDSYQTPVSWAVLQLFPAWAYTVMQAVVFALEGGAPLWFAWRRTRGVALATAVAMHVAIGLMFWPVRWFSLLMITLWCGAYLPEAWLTRATAHLTRVTRA
jgi:uncharacterized membrane protein YphA (DoxX/SURF4 family)